MYYVCFDYISQLGYSSHLSFYLSPLGLRIGHRSLLTVPSLPKTIGLSSLSLSRLSSINPVISVFEDQVSEGVLATLSSLPPMQAYCCHPFAESGFPRSFSDLSSKVSDLPGKMAATVTDATEKCTVQ